MNRVLAAALILLSAASSVRADEFEAKHRRTVQANPPGVSFELSAADGRRAFRVGETIPIRLAFSSDREGVYGLNAIVFDRSGRTHRERYVVSAAEGAEDPLADYYLSGIASPSMGGAGAFGSLGTEPITLKLDLNEWLRFDRPGRYRLYAVSPRIQWDYERNTRPSDKQPGAIASNIVEIVILPRDPAWEEATIEQAVAELTACDAVQGPYRAIGGPFLSPDQEERCLKAARELRFLGSNEAVAAVFKLYSVCDGQFDLQFMLGLVGAVDRAYVRAKFDAAITDPGIGIEAHDLTLMAILAGAEQTDWQIPEMLDRPPPASLPARLAQRGLEHEAQVRHYAEKLALALPGKKPGAARFSFRAVDAFAPEAASKLAYLAEEPTPSAADWSELPPVQQLLWLSESEKWAHLDHSRFLPLLRAMAESSPSKLRLDGGNMFEKPVWEQALKRLHELAPSEARVILVREVQRQESAIRAGSKLLDLLPTPFPEVSDTLAHNLENDPTDAAHLVARFGDDSIYERVEAVYERLDGRRDCGPFGPDAPLLAYLLRTRPAEGAEHIRAAMAAREETGCYKHLLSAVASHYAGPEMRSLAGEFLEDPEPAVAVSAARALAPKPKPFSGFDGW